MLFLEDALAKLELMDPEVVFAVNSDRVIASLKKLSDKYGVTLDAPLLFLLTGGLSEADLPEYLEQEKDLDPSRSKIVAKEFLQTVVEPLTKRLNFLNADPDKEGITIAQEKEYLRRIFKEDLVSELHESPFIKNAFNFRLFDLFEREFSLKKELERLLYENNELLTSAKIKVGEGLVEPTIANWLKDFIDKNGSGMFTAVTLSQYLTDSENTKKLTFAERKDLSDLFMTYANLKFFEELVNKKPMDDWRIIPFDLNELKKPQEAKKQSPKVAVEKPQLQSQEEKLAQYDWNNLSNLERRALLEELGLTQKDLDKFLNNSHARMNY